MKLTVIGFGQCGGRIADEFARLNNQARWRRGIEITPGVFAVNTDLADLSSLKAIQTDSRHRILIGARRTGGHGTGKMNDIAAEIAREDSDKVIEAIRSSEHFYESDAFLLIASAAGGTGSGSLPVMTEILRERYVDKPVYDLIILPFEHEEVTEEKTIYNSAICLKSASSAANAIILVDNQRYVKKDSSLSYNLSEINRLIAAPFYDLLCAGEEKNPKHIGSKTLDAGDIIQTLSGWSVIGYGKSRLPVFRFFFLRKTDFRSKSTEVQRGVQAIDEALSELSLSCDPADATAALYLLAAPDKEMNTELVKGLGDHLRNVAPKATIRNGDYPRERDSLTVFVLLSGLTRVEKIRNYYIKSASLIPEFEKRRKESESRIKDLEDTGRDLPSLL